MWQLLTASQPNNILEFIEQLNPAYWMHLTIKVVFCIWMVFVFTALVSIIITWDTGRGGK